VEGFHAPKNVAFGYRMQKLGRVKSFVLVDYVPEIVSSTGGHIDFGDVHRRMMMCKVRF